MSNDGHGVPSSCGYRASSCGVALGGGIQVDAARRWRRSRGCSPRGWRCASSSASRACFSLRSASSRGDEALVAPPEVHARPVDAVAPRMRGRGGEHRGAHRAAGERDVRDAPSARALDDAVEESRGDRLRESGGIGADHDPLLGDELSHASPASRRFQELPALGDHSTIQDVRIEATELLREALAQGAARQTRGRARAGRAG